MSEIKLSIIIVSWNVRELLKKCLASIKNCQGDLAVDIFVVDNNSNDGSAEMVRKDFPAVRLIANQKNLGFAKANNLALKQVTGEYILLLNPDTEIFPDTLKTALEFMAQHPAVGILGAKMLFPDGSFQPSVRRWPTPWPIILMLLKLPKIFPHLKAIDRYLAKDFDYNKLSEAEQVMGAFMLLPKKIIQEVGLLDERFFVWFEEVDYCRRVKKLDYRIYYHPGVVIIHHGGKSFNQAGVVKNQWHFFKSALLYFLKNNRWRK